jgi:uncharacterized protein (DUF58 family)
MKARELLRITREGWFFIAICLAIGLAAIRSGNNLLFLILGMMLGLMVASGILSELSLRGLSFHRVPPPAIHASRPFLMGISVTNLKRRIASFSIEVEDIHEDRVLDKRCYFLKIPPGRTQSTAYRHAFPRRGEQVFLGFKISTKFPFAILRKSRIVALQTTVEVMPAVYPLPLTELPAPSSTGERQVPLRGRSGDLWGLRDYQAGDDLRDVHWKASAHRGRLILRERQAEAAQEVMILLCHRLVSSDEMSLLRASEQIERGITMAASLACGLLARGHSVGIRTMTESLPTDRGPAHATRILKLLSRLSVTDQDLPPPAASSALLTLRVTPGGTVEIDGPQGALLPLSLPTASKMDDLSSRTWA